MASSNADILLLDTSAALALIVLDHEGHADVATRVRGHRLGLAGHALFETFSVLTRQPPPRRLSPATARAVIQRSFPETCHPPPRAADTLLDEFVAARISGGSVFDALVAAAAREAGLLLISRDRRAAPVYRVVGVRFELV